MIRSSAVLIAAAIGVLVAGVIASSLQLVYASVGVSALAGGLLAVGVLLRRDEIFGGSGAASPGRQPAWPPGDTAEVPVTAPGTAMSGHPGDRALGWPPGPARPATVGPDVSSRPGGRARPARTSPSRGGRPGGYSGTHGAGRGRPPSSPGRRGPADPSWPGQPTRPDRPPRTGSRRRADAEPDGDWRPGAPEHPDTQPPAHPATGRPARPGPVPAGQEHPRQPGADRPSDGAFHRGPPGSGPAAYDDFWDRVSGEQADGGGHDTGAPAWEATAGPRAMGGQRPDSLDERPGPDDSRAPLPDAGDAAARFGTRGLPEQAGHPATGTPKAAPPGPSREDAAGSGPKPRWGLVVPRFTDGEPAAAGGRPPGPGRGGRAEAPGYPAEPGPEFEAEAAAGAAREDAAAGVGRYGDAAGGAEHVDEDAEATADAVREGIAAGAGRAAPVSDDSGAGGVSAGADIGAAASAGADAEDARQGEAGEDRPQQRDVADAGRQPAVGGSPLDDQVIIVQGITRYHRRGCTLIRFLGEDDLESMTRQEAVAANCVPCKACQPDKPSADG